MMLKTMLAMAVTAAAVPLSASWATEPTGPQGTFLWNNTHHWPAFSYMDRNADGIITRDEYAAATGTVPSAAPAVVAAPVATTPAVVAPVATVAAVPCGPGTNVACPPLAYAPAASAYAPAPVVTYTSPPVAYTPRSVAYTPAPLAYAPVVVHPAPFPQYIWHSADSNPPVPPR
jgi:hypothetical protein